jgi:hypothetical protein
VGAPTRSAPQLWRPLAPTASDRIQLGAVTAPLGSMDGYARMPVAPHTRRILGTRGTKIAVSVT